MILCDKIMLNEKSAMLNHRAPTSYIGIDTLVCRNLFGMPIMSCPTMSPSQSLSLPPSLFECISFYVVVFKCRGHEMHTEMEVEKKICPCA